MTLVSNYRYPGSLPFQDSDFDRQLFFGRAHEIQSLFRTVLAENLVVLVAKSGIGKTSLLNAGLLPKLRDKEFFPVMIRCNDPKLPPLDSVYVGMASAIGRYQVECQTLPQNATLWQFFKTMEFWSSKAFWPSDNLLLTPVLILDQFEEFFTLHSQQDRAIFTLHLADLLRGKGAVAQDTELDARPHVKILISIREDFLANLDEMSLELPDILHTLVRLQPLQREQARRAIEEPAHIESANFSTNAFQYTPEAVEAMLQFLSKRQERDRVIATDEIDPFQLQLLCQYIENIVHEHPEKSIIQEDDLGGAHGMQQVLEDFYDAQIHKLTSMREQTLVRNLCENGLISSNKRRRTLEQEDIETRFNISRVLLNILVNNRLLRVEHRLGNVYYELSHDTMIEPIKKSQAKQEAKERERQEAEARQHEIQALRKVESKKRTRRWLAGGLAALTLVCSFFMYQSLQKKYEGLALYKQGNELYTQQDYRHARQRFEEALTLAPTITDIYQKLGIIYNGEGRYGDAVTQLLKVIELKNADAVTYRELGDAYMAVGEYAQASESYQQAITLSPQDPELLRKSGDVFLRTGDNDKAVAAYNQAFGLVTFDYVGMYRGLGDVFFEQRRYDEAITHYQKALALNPDDVESLTGLGDALFALGKFQAANEPYQKRSALDPHNIQSKMRLAMIALATNEPEKAVSVAQEMEGEEIPSITEPEHILITRFALISAYFLLDNQTEAANALKNFLEYYKTLTTDYQKTWHWDGINLFIRQPAADLTESQRTLLRTLSEIIASPLSENTSRIKEVEHTLSQIG